MPKRQVVRVARRSDRADVVMGGRALTACEEDVGWWTPDGVVNGELKSRSGQGGRVDVGCYHGWIVGVESG